MVEVCALLYLSRRRKTESSRVRAKRKCLCEAHLFGASGLMAAHNGGRLNVNSHGDGGGRFKCSADGSSFLLPRSASRLMFSWQRLWPSHHFFLSFAAKGHAAHKRSSPWTPPPTVLEEAVRCFASSWCKVEPAGSRTSFFGVEAGAGVAIGTMLSLVAISNAKACGIASSLLVMTARQSRTSLRKRYPAAVPARPKRSSGQEGYEGLNLNTSNTTPPNAETLCNRPVTSACPIPASPRWKASVIAGG